MTAPGVPAMHLVELFLRAGIGGVEDQPQQLATTLEAVEPEPMSPTTITVESHGPVALLRGPGWAAWVLAVLPKGTDPILVAAAELLAHGLLPASPPSEPLGVSFPDDDSSQPEPVPTWDCGRAGPQRGLAGTRPAGRPRPGSRSDR